MVAIPYPLSTAPGAHPQESAGRLVNCHAVPLGEGAKSSFSIKRLPGLSAFGTTAQTGYRGGHVVGPNFYGAWEGKVYRFTSGGGAGTLVGNLPGTARVSWARNNKVTPDLVVVSPGDGASVVTTGAVSSYPDSDVGQPNSVTYGLGFFFFSYGDGTMLASDINSTAVGALNFATAESKPDTLHRVIFLPNGQLLAAGSSSMEVWGPPINPTGFPLSYISTVPRGLASPYAIAGHEDGFGKGIIWVGDDNGVHTLNGYSPEKISPPDLDRKIEALADKNDLEAGVYVADGHGYWSLSCDDWTWQFNLNSGKWQERESYLIKRWRARLPHNAFGKWLCGDSESGNIIAVDPLSHKEIGNPLRSRIESSLATDFPMRTAVNYAAFNVTTGIGLATGEDPIETDPTIETAWSDDGGVTWSNPIIRQFGRQQRPRYPVEIRRTGITSAMGRRWRHDISDPRPFGFMGGIMQP